MKKILTFFICMTGLSLVACLGGEYPITMEQLPASARQFVLQHFNGAVVSHVTEEYQIISKNYDVWFVTGNKIEFAKDGAWTDVDCKHSAVPAGIVPDPIMRFLIEKYPEAVVVQIERHKRGCEVTLDNHMELKFDKEYRLVELDD